MSRNTDATDRQAAKRLASLIEQELAHPRPFEEIARELPELVPQHAQLGEALKALAVADRKRFWIKSQTLWFSRFGWRLIRPMMAIGVAATGVFFLFDPGEAGSHLLFFLLGVAGLYITLQIYAHFWSRRDDRRLADAERVLRDDLERILHELRGT